jgi:hypothetical protein
VRRVGVFADQQFLVLLVAHGAARLGEPLELSAHSIVRLAVLGKVGLIDEAEPVLFQIAHGG